MFGLTIHATGGGLVGGPVGRWDGRVAIDATVSARPGQHVADAGDCAGEADLGLVGLSSAVSVVSHPPAPRRIRGPGRPGTPPIHSEG